MRIPFLNRVAVVLLCVLLLLLSLFVFLFALNVFGEDLLTSWISTIRTDLRCRIILIAAAAIAALLSIYLLRPLHKADDPLRGTAMISRGEAGGTFITLSAIETMVNRFLQSQSHIREHKTVVSNSPGGVRIDLRLVVSDADISALTENLHKSLEEYIGSVAGIPVKSVRILIDEADLSGSGPIEDVTASNVEPEAQASCQPDSPPVPVSEQTPAADDSGQDGSCSDE